MFCRNCGNELPKEAKFCSECGEPTQFITKAAPVSQPNIEPIPTNTNKKFLSKYQWPIIIGVLIILLLGFFSLFYVNKNVTGEWDFDGANLSISNTGRYTIEATDDDSVLAFSGLLKKSGKNYSLSFLDSKFSLQVKNDGYTAVEFFSELFDFEDLPENVQKFLQKNIHVTDDHILLKFDLAKMPKSLKAIFIQAMDIDLDQYVMKITPKEKNILTVEYDGREFEVDRKE